MLIQVQVGQFPSNSADWSTSNWDVFFPLNSALLVTLWHAYSTPTAEPRMDQPSLTHLDTEDVAFEACWNFIVGSENRAKLSAAVDRCDLDACWDDPRKRMPAEYCGILMLLSASLDHIIITPRMWNLCCDSMESHLRKWLFATNQWK
jgi:hypothetical protein